MLITVNKQVEETLEVNTPCYYRSLTGHHYINEQGVLTTVSDRMISLWAPQDGKYYHEDVKRIVESAKPSTKCEFEKAYMDVVEKFESAIGMVAINS